MLYSAWALNEGLSFLPASCERLSESLAWELCAEHHSATSPVSPTCLFTVRRPCECRSGVTLPLKIHVASPSEHTTCVVTAGAGAVPWRGHPGIQQSRVVHLRHRLHLCRVRSPSGIFSTFVLGWCCTLISACVYLKCHRYCLLVPGLGCRSKMCWKADFKICVIFAKIITFLLFKGFGNWNLRHQLARGLSLCGGKLSGQHPGGGEPDPAVENPAGRELKQSVCP